MSAPSTATLVGGKIGKFTLDQLVASGSFGSVYLGHKESTGERVAVKIELVNHPQPQLVLEMQFFERLGVAEFLPRVRTIRVCDTDPRYHGMVMDLLGPSLNDMRNSMGGTFSSQTATLVMCQLVHILNYVHDRGLIYRDVKPENFLLGQPNTDKWATVHLIDLGLCKCYRDEVNGHIPYVDSGKLIVGTQRYMSTNCHFGRELSRRDDMEAILYLAVFLRKGQLPWHGFTGTPMEKNIQTGEMKQSISPEELCADMPPAFARYLHKVRSLQFEQRPNYDRLYGKFSRELQRMGTSLEEKQYDWNRAHKRRSAISLRVPARFDR